MGSFSYSCQLSGLPITSGSKTLLLLLIPNKNLFEYSEKNLSKFGKSSFVTNDGPDAKYTPFGFPITGIYNDYGGLEDIVEDTNTKVIEEYFNLPIQDIVNIVTSGRKDDGYDDDLSIIKVQDRNEDGELSPVYKEGTELLLKLSATWIHGDLFDTLVSEEPKSSDYDKVDLGNPEILKELGFTEMDGKGSDSRYNRKFVKDGLIVTSDGTWLGAMSEHGIYTLPHLKRFCEGKGVTIEIDEINKKGRIEQVYDYLLPPYRATLDGSDSSALTDDEQDFFDEMVELILGKSADEIKEEISEESKTRFRELSTKVLNRGKKELGDNRDIDYIFLGRSYGDGSPLSDKYILASATGDLKSHVIGFSILRNYMYTTGRYWDIIGMAPQDGDYKGVKKLLEASLKVINEKFSDYLVNYDEDDEY